VGVSLHQQKQYKLLLVLLKAKEIELEHNREEGAGSHPLLLIIYFMNPALLNGFGGI
jgi:hypothetical protein